MCCSRSVRLHELTIAHVTDCQLGAFGHGLPIATQQRVENDYLVACFDETLRRGAADESGPAGDKDSHFFSPLCFSSAR